MAEQTTDDDYELEFDSDSDHEKDKEEKKDTQAEDNATKQTSKDTLPKLTGSTSSAKSKAKKLAVKASSTGGMKKMYGSTRVPKQRKPLPQLNNRPTKSAPAGTREQDLLVVKDREIAALKQEIKTLESMHRRQTKALQDMDASHQNMPQQIASQQDEMKGLREQIRALTAKLSIEEKNSKIIHERMQKYKSRSTDLLELIKAKGIEEDTDSEGTQEELEKQRKKVSDLEHQVQILMKIREQDEKKMKAKIKEAQQETVVVRQQLEELQNKRVGGPPASTTSSSANHNDSKPAIKLSSSPQPQHKTNTTTVNGRGGRSPSPTKPTLAPTKPNTSSKTNFATKPTTNGKSSSPTKQPPKKPASDDDEDYDELFDKIDEEDAEEEKPKTTTTTAPTTTTSTAPTTTTTTAPTTTTTTTVPTTTTTAPAISTPVPSTQTNGKSTTNITVNDTDNDKKNNNDNTPAWLRDTPSGGKPAGGSLFDMNSNSTSPNMSRHGTAANNSAVSTPTIFKPNMGAGGGRSKNDWKSKLADPNLSAPLFSDTPTQG